jgi:two-component system, cell cycle response regulator
MAARQLTVLLVSSDRKALRHTNKLLAVFGYQVICVTGFARARQLLSGERPDIAVIDGSSDMAGALELCTELSRSARENYLFKALLVNEPTPNDVSKALESGVDEILAYPIEHGELLARLRTAARVLEYERRVGACFGGSSADDAGGPTRFVRELKSQLDSMRAKPEPVTCVAIEIDHFVKLQAVEGVEAANAAAEAAFRLVREASQEKLLARLEAHRYAVAFRSSADRGMAWANELHDRVVSMAAAESEKESFTVSCGVATRKSDATTPEDLLSAACSTVAKAQQSGGDYVAREDEFSDEEKCWTELAKTGALFERTVARDIMVPCTVTLKSDDSIAWAAETFERTRLRALAVVDEEGKLAGLLTAQGAQLRGAGEGTDKVVSSVMSREVVSFDEQTTLAALIDYFTQESPLVIVIVNKGRPTGMVTPSSLATLSEQLTTDSFAATSLANGRADFVVPNLCGVDAA